MKLKYLGKPGTDHAVMIYDLPPWEIGEVRDLDTETAQRIDDDFNSQFDKPMFEEVKTKKEDKS